MTNFDDIFEGQAPQPNPEFDRDAWAAQKQAARQRVFELADTTAESIVKDSDKFRDFLDTQAKFDRYSVTNALLILAQMPQATQIKSFDDWKKADVNIKKDQKGFYILEPGKAYERGDGSKGTSYEPKRVFDISQTTAKVTENSEVPRDERTILKALIHKPPVSIEVTDELSSRMGAYYDHGQKKILVRRGMTAPEIFRYVSSELVRAELAVDNPTYDRSATSFTAYCASYILCKKNGIDVSGYQFNQLPDCLRNGDPRTIRDELGKIHDTVGTISKRMYRAMNPERQSKPKQQQER